TIGGSGQRTVWSPEAPEAIWVSAAPPTGAARRDRSCAPREMTAAESHPTTGVVHHADGEQTLLPRARSDGPDFRGLVRADHGAHDHRLAQPSRRRIIRTSAPCLSARSAAIWPGGSSMRECTSWPVSMSAAAACRHCVRYAMRATLLRHSA